MLKHDFTISLCAPPRCQCPELHAYSNTNTVVIQDLESQESISLTFEDFEKLAIGFLEHTNG